MSRDENNFRSVTNGAHTRSATPEHEEMGCSSEGSGGRGGAYRLDHGRGGLPHLSVVGGRVPLLETCVRDLWSSRVAHYTHSAVSQIPFCKIPLGVAESFAPGYPAYGFLTSFLACDSWRSLTSERPYLLLGCSIAPRLLTAHIIENWRRGSAAWPASVTSLGREGNSSSLRPVSTVEPIISAIERDEISSGTSIKIPKYQYVGCWLRMLDEMW